MWNVRHFVRQCGAYLPSALSLECGTDLDQINFAASIRPFPRCGEDDFFEWLLATFNNFGCFTRTGLGVPRTPPKTRRSKTKGAGVPAM